MLAQMGLMLCQTLEFPDVPLFLQIHRDLKSKTTLRSEGYKGLIHCRYVQQSCWSSFGYQKF